MLNTAGERVRVRDRKTSDSLMEGFWAQDKELLAANPSAGRTFNDWKFSIETLDGEHIGSCNLYNHTGTEIQLGISIGEKDYWNKGYGTEVVNILTNFCFATMDVEFIWLKVLPWNARAIKCYVKCGFERTGWLALNGYDFVRMEKRREQ